jgi:hypothetical protein
LANSRDLIPTVGGDRSESTPVRNCLEDRFLLIVLASFGYHGGAERGKLKYLVWALNLQY